MATAVRNTSRLEKPTLRRNDIARAVRLALATSASLLALSGSVQAGVCVPAAPTAGDTVECDGIFTNTITYAVDDLTVLIGSNDPATAVNTVGEDGITLTDATSGFVQLHVYGEVTSDMATAYGVNVIDIRADGDVWISNHGDLVLLGDNEVYGSPNIYATAVLAYSYDGNVTIVSSGSITSSTDNLIAYAMVGRADYLSYVVNGGDLDVSSDNNIAMGMLSISTYDSASVQNFGDVVVSGGGPLRSAGGFAISYQGDAVAVNGGSITVTASGATAQGMAAVANNGDAFAYNFGSIDVDGALASFGLVATGASADLDNQGDVFTSSDQNATALRSRAISGYATLDNSGHAEALASAGFNAYGIATIGYYGADALSSGSVSAQVAGATGTATGVLVQSGFGDVYFGNDGDVLASGGAYAIGVKLDAYGDGLLVNTGSISASNGALGSFAVVSGDGDDQIDNQGQLDGALDTGDGDDLLLNLPTGTWQASGSSLFGNGDDLVSNDGTIQLDDAVIDFGAATSSNQFDNQGTVAVAGAGNLIDMGGAFLFVNDDLLDFRNGATGDALTINGNFAGDGHIGFDVSGLDGSADQLYIDGNVAPASTSAVDIALLDLPLQGGFDIPLIHVSGNSVAGNFALGNVAYDSGGLLDVGFSLVPDVDASNASDDVYSLRMELLGLGEAGAIAAAAAPGVQVLMHSVVGTLAQRNVSLGDAPSGRFSAFARVYRNRGSICPGQSSALIGDSNDLCFDQTNSGGETGFDFAGTDKFSFGLLLGKAGADQKLQTGGARSDIQGDVKGAFGTMRLPQGIYADLSHRRVDFDVDMRTPDGPLATTGTAETTNAETGYKWKSQNGLVLEGQFQTMRTRLVSVGPVGSAVEFASKPDLSVISRLGLSATKYFKPGASGTLWEVHANANFIRESHAENDYVIDGELEGSTDLGGNSTMLEIGFTGRRGLLLMFGGLSWQDGGALENFIGGTLGAKYTW